MSIPPVNSQNTTLTPKHPATAKSSFNVTKLLTLTLIALATMASPATAATQKPLMKIRASAEASQSLQNTIDELNSVVTNMFGSSSQFKSDPVASPEEQEKRKTTKGKMELENRHKANLVFAKELQELHKEATVKSNEQVRQARELMRDGL